MRHYPFILRDAALCSTEAAGRTKDLQYRWQFFKNIIQVLIGLHLN